MTAKNSGLRVIVPGLVLGAAVALLLCMAGGLSPLAALDRPALALWALCAALPMGAALGRPGLGVHSAGLHCASALAAGVVLATLVTLGDPALWLRAASWCGAAALVGGALATVARGGGMVACVLWLALCALPFFSGKLGSMSEPAKEWALHGCPWLGFAKDALDPDPLRLPVLYLGQWSSLSDQPALGLLSAAELWLAGLLSLAAALLRAGVRAPVADAPARP